MILRKPNLEAEESDTSENPTIPGRSIQAVYIVSWMG